VVHIAADLPQFLQRRELAAYEQRLARTAYAYGVDLRRAQWLSGSTVGDPLMRSVDRRWSRLTLGLEEDSLRPQRKAPPTELLEETSRLIHLLRAPLPTLRLLRPEVAAQWPAITPLGTTKGSIHWLVLDLDRVMALPADERTFVLAAGLGHLQCDHGPIFAAHLMAHRRTGTGAHDEGRRTITTMVRGLLRPWAKVAVFSADRAGHVAVASLPVALRVIERQQAEHVPWMPRWPSFEARRTALEDFDRSAIMARRRVLSNDDGGGWAIAPPGREEELDSLSRKLAAAFDGAIRLGGRLAMRIEGYQRRNKGGADESEEGEATKAARDGDEAGKASEASESKGGGSPRSGKADEGSHGAARNTDGASEGKAKPSKAGEASGDAARSKGKAGAGSGSDRTARASEATEAGEGTAGEGEPSAPALDPERAARLEHALRDAWTLARCDQRLTHRLGLL
jgi:hypothetical protein